MNCKFKYRSWLDCFASFCPNLLNKFLTKAIAETNRGAFMGVGGFRIKGGAVNLLPERSKRPGKQSEKLPDERDLCPIEGGCSSFANPSPTLMVAFNDLRVC